MKLWQSIKDRLAKIFGPDLCPVCGELSTRTVNRGRIFEIIRCRCTFYQLACNRPIREEDYIDDYGVKCERMIFACDIYPEEYLRAEADQMFESQQKYRL